MFLHNLEQYIQILFIRKVYIFLNNNIVKILQKYEHTVVTAF